MKVNEKIVFKYNNTTLVYKVWQTGDKYILINITTDAYQTLNQAIFILLGIEDRFSFCKEEIGYSVEDKLAGFPELNSLSDLEKVVNALYRRIIEISTPKFKVGDLVMIVKREGNGSDYPCTYMDEMIQYENQIFTISKINKMSTSIIKSFTSRLRYEEPFFYTVEGNDWNWSSAMLRKVEIIGDVIKDIITPDEVVLADIGKVNIDGISSYMDVHTPVITCDKAINGPSIYPEREESEYKLNFSIKPLKFLRDV